MKIKPIYNSPFLLKGYDAITLYPFIFFRYEKEKVLYTTLKHEMVHVAQIRKHGWFTFYFSYLIYYFAGLLYFRNHQLAYFDIPYERQAFDGQFKPLSQEEANELGVD